MVQSSSPGLQRDVCADGLADRVAGVPLQALHASAEHPAGLGRQRRTGGKGRPGRGQSPAGTVPRNGSDPAPSRVMPAGRTPPAGRVVQYASYEQARDRQQNQALYNVSPLQGRPVYAHVLVQLLCLTSASPPAFLFVLPALLSLLQLSLGTCSALPANTSVAACTTGCASSPPGAARWSQTGSINLCRPLPPY